MGNLMVTASPLSSRVRHEPYKRPVAGCRAPKAMYPFVVANSDDNRLRSEDAEGSVTLLNLTGPLERPEGMARDRSGNLYVANYIEKGWIAAIAPSGKVSALIPPEAGLSFPIGVVISPDKSLLVSVVGTGSIARVDPNHGIVKNASWISGLNGPRTMAFDAAQRLYVAISVDNTLRRYSLQGVPIPLNLQGAGLVRPFGLAFDAKGTSVLSLPLQPAYLIQAASSSTGD